MPKTKKATKSGKKKDTRPPRVRLAELFRDLARTAASLAESCEMVDARDDDASHLSDAAIDATCDAERLVDLANKAWEAACEGERAERAERDKRDSA